MRMARAWLGAVLAFAAIILVVGWFATNRNLSIPDDGALKRAHERLEEQRREVQSRELQHEKQAREPESRQRFQLQVERLRRELKRTQ